MLRASKESGLKIKVFAKDGSEEEITLSWRYITEHLSVIGEPAAVKKDAGKTKKKKPK